VINDRFLTDVAAPYISHSKGQSIGSGCLIAPGLILTAGHVVDFPRREASRCDGWEIWLLSEKVDCACRTNFNRAAHISSESLRSRFQTADVAFRY